MDKKEFDMQKKLVEMEKKAKLEVEKVRHQNRIKEIEEEELAKRRVFSLRHEYDLERQRIKTAEIKRTFERKQDARFAEDYSKRQEEKRY